MRPFGFTGLNIYMKTGYLPEYHGFRYRAWAPWPQKSAEQMDWVDGVILVEDWLQSFVGPHHSHWAWDRVDLCQQGQYLGVAFKESNHRLMFILRWC